MVGAAGIVASTINNRHIRRESRTSQQGEGGDHYGRHGSKATISDRHHGHHPGHIPGSFHGPHSKNATDPPEIIPEKLTFREQVKFYVSLTLGIVASICVFALLFLIPLVVEPSISTLLADFDPEAATCVTIDYTYAIGLSKCGAWSSCREGCTSTPSQCHQIYVSYRKANKPGYAPIKNFSIIEEKEWLVSRS